MNEKKDFYYSQKSFEIFKLDELFNEEEIVGEVLIDGEWKLFTEQITKGKKALSVWEDLVFLGSSDTTRYTRAPKWIAQNEINNVLK